MTPIKSIMHTSVCIIAVHATVEQAMRMMEQSRARTLLLAGDNNELCGVFSEHDLVRRVFMEKRFPEKTRLQEVARLNPLSLEEGAPVRKVAKKIVNRPHEEIPVVDQNGKPIGLVSSDTIFPFLADRAEELIEGALHRVSLAEAMATVFVTFFDGHFEAPAWNLERSRSGNVATP